MPIVLTLLAALALGACKGPEVPAGSTPEPMPTPPAFDDHIRLHPRLVEDLKRVPEVFRTVPLTEGKDIDSLAFWPGTDGTPWLLVTQKDISNVLVLDAVTGELLNTVGGMGEALGTFNRPNGIAVVDDLVLVVDQRSHRVQVLRLPGFDPLGSFGEDLLQRPYGVAVDHPGEWYEVFVTDSYDSPEHEPPTAEVGGNRVRHYRFRTDGGSGFETELVRSFGAREGEGMLFRVESLVIDRELGRLYIADESRLQLNMKVYSLDGEYLDTTFGEGWHYREPEGIVLLRCGAGDAGFVIAADQTQPARFLVYDRQSLAQVGGFTGEPTIDITDGTAFAPEEHVPGTGGMFYATHHDVQVVGYRWRDIAEAMGLSADCR